MWIPPLGHTAKGLKISKSSNPGIDLAWGGNAWKASERRVVRPYVESALDLTQLAMDDMGISYIQPKVATVWRCSRSEESQGTSDGAVHFDLHVRVDHIKHRQVGRQFNELFKTSSHELIHAVRSEIYDDDRIIEAAASEGLAYIGEDIISGLVLGPDESFFAGQGIIDSSADGDYEGLKRRLGEVKDLQSLDEYGQEVPQYDRWITVDGRSVPPGILVGVVEVQRRIIEGNSFNQLLSWPAEELLDVRSAV